MDIIIPFLADGLVFVLAAVTAVVAVWCVSNRHKFAVYSRMLVAGLTAYLVAKIMSVIYQPTQLRPFELMNVDPGASYLNNPGFPSDHALFVWVMVWAVWYMTKRRWLTVVCAVIALAVCVGRVLALVHAPIDVVGGTLAAAIGALWYFTNDTCKKDKSSVK